MADAIISVGVERVAAIIEDLIREEVSLVRGAEAATRSLSSELNIIKIALDDGESRRFKDKNLNNWLTKLEHIAYEMEDVLDEWNYAILKLKIEGDDDRDHEHESKKKVCSFIPSSSSCFCFKKVVVRRDIAKKIKQVKGQLDLLLKEKDKFKSLQSQPANHKQHLDEHLESQRVQSTSFIDLAKVHGRDTDRDNLVRKLMSGSGGQTELGVQIISIVGVGGLGKTTLAQQVYNDDRVKSSFELMNWICVSDPFNEAVVLKRIIESVRGVGSCPSTDQLNVLCECLRESILGKKFFLVLDDVWTEDYNKWEPIEDSLKCGGAGSIILVTTRNQDVARMMGTTETDILRLGELSDDDCWFIISRLALSGRNKEKYEEVESIGMNIAKKCKGLPLAAKTLGSVLRSKNSVEEWENVLDSKIWELEKVEVELFPHLLLSYNELSPTLKRCFSYCAVFPKDYEIEVEEITRIWMAQGYLVFNIGNVATNVELKGREYFNILAMHSLFQDFQTDDSVDEQIVSFKMHDIVHDFAHFLRKNRRVVEATGMQKTNCKVCDPLLVSIGKEYRTLFCRDAESPPCLCDCRSLRTLGLVKCNMTSIPPEMEKLIHLRWLDLSYNDFSGTDTKVIYKLYNLQLLRLKGCGIHEISREIRNLIRLRHLDVSHNKDLKELPECICDLDELRTLNVGWCESLEGLPEGIDRLKNLKHLHSKRNNDPLQFPRGLAQLTSLRTLTQYFVGSGDLNKLAWLKNLNHLSGTLNLRIRLSSDDDLEDMVEDAREAELSRKTHIQRFQIEFDRRSLHQMDDMVISMKMEHVIDALEPHPNLRNLTIYRYQGTKLPSWIACLNQLRFIHLNRCTNVSLLYSLGKLLFLEEIQIRAMDELQFLGREFFGMSSSSSTSMSGGSGGGGNTIIAFPKLKKLKFVVCKKWKEWEDITAEEEHSTTLLLMPCLTTLIMNSCPSLMALPHRFLSKLSSLETLDIRASTKLDPLYGKDDSALKSISQNNPRLQLKLSRKSVI